MVLDKRSNAILNEFLNKEGPISVNDLIKKYHISRRTVYYDLEKISNWLKEHSMEDLQFIRGEGYYLTEHARENIPKFLNEMEEWAYELSPEERIGWMVVRLLVDTSPLFLADLSEFTRVSRNTTIEDLKLLKKELESLSLTLQFDRQKGYIITGDELNQRRAIVHFLHKLPSGQNPETFFNLLKHFFTRTNETPECHRFVFNQILSALNEGERELDTEFADETLYNLAFRFWLFGKRIDQGKTVTIDPVEKKIIRKTKEFLAAKTICKKLSTLFSAPINDNEICYLTTHLLSAKVQYSEGSLNNNDLRPLLDVAKKMVTDFQIFACISFPNPKEVADNLFLHLKPAYFRIKYGLNGENPLVDQVKREYPDIFLITKRVVNHFEQFVGEKLKDSEIAYIAIHFGGWIRREGLSPKVRKRAVIICPNGIGTSAILRQQLENLFSSVDFVETMSVREFERRSFDDIDFAVSTTRVKQKQFPVFVVHPILTDIDKEGLLKKVHGLSESVTHRYSPEAVVQIIKQYANIFDEDKLLKGLREYFYKPDLGKGEGKPDLEEVLHKPFIQILPEVKSWEEAVSVAAEPLLASGLIGETYVKAMIHYIKKNGPYLIIAPKIALPHALPEDGSYGIGISLLVLKKPVAFSEQKRHRVNLIFVLSSIDQDSHIRALSRLTDVLSSPETVEEIIQSDDSDHIWNLLTGRRTNTE